ncbi:hypothetical protein F01_420899 [Burkholderia cenocepacia]|nr:hypothetical protein F01_420899 [Burkholderia cenocepacia]
MHPCFNIKSFPNPNRRDDPGRRTATCLSMGATLRRRYG